MTSHRSAAGAEAAPGTELPPLQPGTDAGEARRERLLLLTVALGALLAPLNSTMIAVALPSITVDLGAGAAATSWLVTAYLISMASLQPVAGRLGDQLGRRRLILGGLVGFGIASVGATFAPNLPLLILFRVLQAVSGAVVLPNGDALLREIVPDERRASRFGAIGSAIGLAAAVGPLLGGVLVSTAGWRTMFAVNVLLVVPPLLLGWRCIPRRTPRHADLSGKAGAGKAGTATARAGTARAAFDWPGAVMLSAVLVSLALLLSRGSGLPPQVVAGAAAALLVVFAIFVRRELRHPEPVLQPRFFTRPAFAAATGAVGLSNLAMYSVLLALPILWARDGRPAAEIGSMLGVMAAAMVVAAPVGGRLSDRFGRRWPTVIGLAALTVGAIQIALTALAGLGSVPTVVMGLAILGGGLGLATPGLQASALEAVERHSAGAAAGAYSTSRYLGSIVGAAILAGLAGSASTGPSSTDVESVALIFVAVVVAAVLATVLGLGLPGRPTAGKR